MEDYLILICCSAVAFALLSIICSCWWYAKRQHVSYTAALRVLWQEGIVEWVQEDLMPWWKSGWNLNLKL